MKLNSSLTNKTIKTVTRITTTETITRLDDFEPVYDPIPDWMKPFDPEVDPEPEDE